MLVLLNVAAESVLPDHARLFMGELMSQYFRGRGFRHLDAICFIFGKEIPTPRGWHMETSVSMCGRPDVALDQALQDLQCDFSDFTDGYDAPLERIHM